MKTEIINAELLNKWGACKDVFNRFCELFQNGADLETAINALAADGHDDWGKWLFDKCKANNIFNEITIKGYRNTGNANTGDANTGDWNSGSLNSGSLNTGSLNSGNWNSGDWNSGDRNSGNWNSGDRNSGGWNSGDWNSGDWNSGDWNSGDWNSGDGNSGFFNTETPKEILVFDKKCLLEEWNNSYKPNFLFFNITYWVSENEMSDEDKKNNPYFYVSGGQLRKRDYKEAFMLSWKNADKEDRIKIKDLPNFDKEKFFEISGIDIDKD